MVQGRVDVARALLKLHSEADTNEFKLVDNALKSMPVYNVSTISIIDISNMQETLKPKRINMTLKKFFWFNIY